MATTPSLSKATVAQITTDFLGTSSGMSFAAATGSHYSAIYAFGDSLSDVGNVYDATLHALPVSPPYVGGYFSNGPVWVQDLAQSLGLAALKPSLAGGTDFAVGGATTGAEPGSPLNPTDLPGQLAMFVAHVPHPQANALYTVWIGSNDVLDIADDAATAQQAAEIASAVKNEAAFIAGLAAHGAKDLVVLDVPDLGKTPSELARGATAAANASSLSALYDQDLSAALKSLTATGALKVDLIDTYKAIDAVIANPAAYGFTNVTQPVWTGNFSNPHSGTLAATGAAQNGYLFFDSLHPTAQAHALLAQAVTQSLTVAA
jgi:phospholipase/lecithinase/hemolysin